MPLEYTSCYAAVVTSRTHRNSVTPLAQQFLVISMDMQNDMILEKDKTILDGFAYKPSTNTIALINDTEILFYQLIAIGVV